VQIRKEEKYRTLKSKKSMKGRYVFTAEAVSQIINETISIFYADNIYNSASTFSIDDIGRKQFENSIDLISVPYEGVDFDSDGEQCSIKYIINNGKVTNVFANVLFSKLCNNIAAGNANLLDRYSIGHQRLIFNAQKCICCEFEGVVNNISSISCYDGKIIGEAVVKYENIFYRSMFEIDVDNFFGNVRSYDSEYKWIKNVKCSQCIVTI